MANQRINFVNAVKLSFWNAKKDITNLKQNTSDWIIFLNSKDLKMQGQIRMLEQKVRELEMMREAEISPMKIYR